MCKRKNIMEQYRKDRGVVSNNSASVSMTQQIYSIINKKKEKKGNSEQKSSLDNTPTTQTIKNLWKQVYCLNEFLT